MNCKKFGIALILTLAFSVSFQNVQAEKNTDYPRTVSLIFDDKTLELDFKLQDELIAQQAEHFIKIGSRDIPVDFGDKLPEDSQQIIPIQTRFKPVMSEKKLHEFLEQSGLLKNVRQSTVEVRYQTKRQEKIIFSGDPQAGYSINFQALVQTLNLALETNTQNVQVPAEKVFSQVIAHPDLEENGIKEIIAIGESNFSGSSRARRQNIIAGLNKFNGVIIKRGKIFSFNDILESVDEKDGFVKELVIKGNKTEKELGGGVCQVSTTAFRAALNGGLPIRARRNHSYAVPYYKPFGLDAAIYLGQLDLRFKNDTPGDMLVQSYVEDDNIYFVFYGTHDDRTIALRGPYISNHKNAPDPTVLETEDLPTGEMKVMSEAHDGFTTEWIRTVSKDGVLDQDTFRSVYRPWPATIKKGTGKKIVTLNDERVWD